MNLRESELTVDGLLANLTLTFVVRKLSRRIGLPVLQPHTILAHRSRLGPEIRHLVGRNDECILGVMIRVETTLRQVSRGNSSCDHRMKER